MPLRLLGANAVVLSQRPFKPGDFSFLWAARKLRVNADDVPEHGSVQSPLLFNLPTTRFSLVVIKERIQLNLPERPEEGGETEGEMVKRIMHEAIVQVQEFSSVGAGFNFNWELDSNERPNSETTRQLFSAEDKPFFREFAGPDACFGVYASKDFMGIRLRVEARPIHEPNQEPNGRQVIFNFNFNVDLGGNDQVAEIDRLLDRWQDAKGEAFRIMTHVVGRHGA